MSDALTIEGMEQLLFARPGYSMDDDCPSMEQVAVALESAMAAQEVVDRFPHVRDCEHCEEAIRIFMAINDDDLMSDIEIESINESKEKQRSNVVSLHDRRGLVRISLAVAASLLLGVGAFVWVSFFNATLVHDAPVDGVESTLTAKGATHDFEIAVSRQNDRFALLPGDEVETGDNLGFFYTAPANGYLTVFFVDEHKNVSSLYPSEGETAVAIAQGVRMPIKDGARVTPADGCEWIVAVFTNEEIGVEKLRKEILSTMAIRNDCRLHVAPSRASQVTVQQIRGRVSQ